MSHKAYQKYNFMKLFVVLAIGIFLILHYLMYCYLENMLNTEQTNLINYYFNLITNLLTEFQINDLIDHGKLQEFKMLLDKLLPENIEYKILLKEKVIAISKNYNSQYIFHKSLILDDYECIKIQLNCAKTLRPLNIFIINLIASCVAYFIIFLALFNNIFYIKKLKLNTAIKEQPIDSVVINKKPEQQYVKKVINKAISTGIKKEKNNNIVLPLRLSETNQGAKAC